MIWRLLSHVVSSDGQWDEKKWSTSFNDPHLKTAGFQQSWRSRSSITCLFDGLVLSSIALGRDPPWLFAHGREETNNGSPMAAISIYTPPYPFAVHHTPCMIPVAVFSVGFKPVLELELVPVYRSTAGIRHSGILAFFFYWLLTVSWPEYIIWRFILYYLWIATTRLNFHWPRNHASKSGLLFLFSSYSWRSY